ncbi:MAG: ArnT family glycosyltransferase, partial [Kiritimatiellia bacterium]|nr:glycosyltransferase family 39 protein [Lentisphaerota bacterium]
MKFLNLFVSCAQPHPSLPAAYARPPRWLWLLLLLISLAGIGNHELWTPDEPREAAITLAMRRSGELAIPRLAGEPFVEKPPLAYIAGAGILALGETLLGTTAALRLSSALWGLATLGVTFLLARRLAGPVTAAWSVAALALMPGFVQVTHWLLVDSALMFMIAAALWLLYEAYSRRRPPLLALAGIAAAGAFLVKGLIGPLIMGLGWLGLALSLARTGTWRYWLGRRSCLWHLIALMLFGLLTGIWMLALRMEGGPELWHEWFWDNHFGRFSGQARHLGHIRGPFYYVSALAVCLLPWLGYWFYGICQAWRRGRGLTERLLRGPWPLLLAWAGGGLLLLTVSSTKREIYLSMLMPALAIITGLLLRRPPPRWLHRYLLAWQGLALMILAAAVPAPLLGWLLGWCDWTFGLFWSLLALLALAAAWRIVRRATIPWLSRFLAVTALAY